MRTERVCICRTHRTEPGLRKRFSVSSGFIIYRCPPGTEWGVQGRLSKELMMCIHYQNNNQNIIPKWPGINNTQRTRCKVEPAAWEKTVSVISSLRRGCRWGPLPDYSIGICVLGTKEEQEEKGH